MSKICSDCKFKNSLPNRMIGDLFIKSNSWASARAIISKDARRRYSGKMSCSICGYDKHSEIAHIKPVSSFDDNALIKDINNPDNLIALCPNHHWEYDNGLLEI